MSAAGRGPTLVIRLSSLGDVVLCGAVTGALAPVSFLTRAAWAPVAARLPGVTEVLVYEEVLAGRTRLSTRWERIVDLHASPRSRRLCAGLRGPLGRVQRHDLRRRLRVSLKLGAPPPRVVERYAQAAGVPVAPRPWIAGARGGSTLVLCPGAAHATKRWSPEGFVAVGRAWAGPVAVLGGPGDEALVGAIAQAVGAGASPITEQGFARSFEVLAEAALVVAGDTGLLHLAGAMGVPVLGLFGPTTGADGFWDPGYGRLLELDLPCRPCSLHGGPACPIGDHLCLEGLDAGEVIAAVAGMRAGAGAGAGAGAEGPA